jgi:taurine dioxygenase
MAYESIEVSLVTPVIGAEVAGVDLRRPSNRQFEEIHAALLAHQVLFFRDQQLDFDSHLAFGRHFGELHIHPGAPGVSGHPEIQPIHADARSTYIVGQTWHSDVSCEPEPPMGSILHLGQVPPVGGDTLFASMYAAYERLSPRMKTYLDGLTAIHDGEVYYRGRYVDRGVDDRGKIYPRASHPVIRTHPETGRKALYVNRTLTTRIEGVSPRGERGDPRLSDRPLRQAGVPGAVSLAREFRRLLGQPLRPASGALGLLSPDPFRLPGPDQGRQAVLTRASHK